MAIMALSIVGLYNYDNDIFSGFNVPEGVDRNAAIYDIMFNCAELELLYQDWDFMRKSITAWSLMMLPIWQKLYDTTQLEYNPIWNVDADITELETRNLAGTDGGTKTREGNTTDNTTTEETVESTLDHDATIEHDVMGYNVSSGYQHESRDTEDSTDTQDFERNVTVDGSGTSKETEKDTRNRTDTGTIEHKTRRTGNIGVTTSQQMIREEREIDLFNIYDQITQDFKRRFCVLVY